MVLILRMKDEHIVVIGSMIINRDGHVIMTSIPSLTKFITVQRSLDTTNYFRYNNMLIKCQHKVIELNDNGDMKTYYYCPV